MNARWLIRGSFTTTTPMHIGTGATTKHAQIVDENKQPCDVAAVVKDYRGFPCLPGTAIKGVLRAWAESFFPSEAPGIERIFGRREFKATDAEAGWAEFTTAMVEPPTQSVLERFEQFVPYWRPEHLTGIASNVCISRFTGAAQAKKLFYQEFVPEGVTFSVEIPATRLTDGAIALLLAILEAGATHATHPYQLGANAADGWGRVAWSLRGDVKQWKPSAASRTGPATIGFACCTQDWHRPATSIPTASVPAHASVELVLDFQGPFLVNDASRAKSEEMSESEKKIHTNFTPLLRADGSFWLPASSFRGALRARAEVLLRCLNPKATGDPNETLGDGPIERIFGHTSRAARLTIEEFVQIKACVPRKQDFVAIDRFTGGAADDAKFDALYADAPTLKTTMTLDLNGLEPEDVALLAFTLRDVCEGKVTFGFGASKGYGIAKGSLSDFRSSGVEPAWNVPASAWGGTIDADAVAWLSENLLKLQVSSPPTATTPAESAPVKPPAPAIPLVLKQGRLKWQGSGKNRRRVLQVPSITLPYQLNQPNELAPALRQSTADDIPVEFELQRGQPVRIRPEAEAWGTAAPQVGPNPVINAPGRFIHPYYFLAFSDRSKFTGELADRLPIGHRHLEPDRYTGTIRVRLTTKTPLLVCDDENIVEDKDGHKTYAMRIGADKRPLIMPSSVRGMLRSSYEAITNSRFGVFPAQPGKGHTRRMGFRMTAREGLSVVPVRIEGDTARLMLGTNPYLPEFNPHLKRWSVRGGLLHAAWVNRYEMDRPRVAQGAIRIDGQLPRHRQRAWCWLQKVEHVPPPFSFWAVREAALEEAGLSEQCPQSVGQKGKQRSLEETLKTEGFFCITNQNIKNKHDERFFFGRDEIVLDLDPNVAESYLELVRDYRAIHTSDLAERKEHNRRPDEYLGSEPGDTAWSRQVYLEEDLSLTNNPLCYGQVIVNRDGTWKLVALYPVTISRRLYTKSPFDLLPEKLRPASQIQQLSPADRVFGWVSQDKGTKDLQPAYRGQIRVGTVTCESDDAIETFATRHLAILGQPKPQQGRFYLGKADGTVQAAGLSKEQAGYSGDNRIRGPKVYPHHRAVTETNWAGEEPNKQNRSITGWIKPGTSFAFDLQVENLSRIELGALVWLLSLPEDHFLRMGLGKPLGFGSVRAVIVPDGTRIADGNAWARTLPEWDSSGPTACELAPMQAEFEAEIAKANPALLKSFLRAAAGFEGLPVNYPRTPDQPAQGAEHYEWFVKNDGGPQRPLPDLFAGDPSLPVNPT